jgi:hypothetical protein
VVGAASEKKQVWCDMKQNQTPESSTKAAIRLNAAACCLLLLAGLLASPMAGADLEGAAKDAIGEPSPAPVKGELVLDAALPANPITAYVRGTGPAMQVQLLHAEPMAGGFTLIDPTGMRRFTDQFSDEAGTVDFFEVSWATPYGDWTLTHKPGLPAFTPEILGNETLDPRYDPGTYVDEILLRFTINEREASVPSPSEVTDDPPGTLPPANETLPGAMTIASNLTEPKTSTSSTSGRVGCNGCNYDPNTGYTGPSGYVYCATEGDRCSFPDTRDVAYGANGRYNYRYGVTGGIDCTNAVFGDPYAYKTKACYTKAQTPQTQTTYVAPSAGYTFCAYENQYCDVSGTKTVAYGNSGSYYYQFARTAGITCNNSNFGDPLVGTPKACWTTDSYPVKSPPSGYTWCADEGQTCSYSGTRDAAYGASGNFAYRYSASGGFTCGIAYFGQDPFPGVYKSCYTKAPVNYVPPNNGYTFCANEGQYCSVSGTKTVAFGNSGSYTYSFARTTGVNCDTQNLGDPAPGVPKACWTTDSYPARSAPSGYSFCAEQYQTCSFSGTRDVAYGASGYYTYKSAVSGSIYCHESSFASDPYPGVWKSCYVKDEGNPVNCAYSPPNWQQQSNVWKWVNTVIAHAPEFGYSTAETTLTSTTDEYFFGGGSTKQTIGGEILTARNGYTIGTYKLMGVAYYTATNVPAGCPTYKVEMTEYDGTRDSLGSYAIQGASTSTDADDLIDFTVYSSKAGGNVKSLTIYHRFVAADNARTTGTTGESCRVISSVSGQIQGFDVSASFSTAGGAVSVGGSLSYKTSQTSTSTYRYCFGQGHRYEWDDLGGTSDNLASAFRTVY